MSGRWRASLRLAGRLARRSPRRSLLIVLLIALPVLAGVFVSVTVSTARLSPEQTVTRDSGRADAVVGVGMQDNGTPGVGATQLDVTALLPAGSRATPAAWGIPVRVATSRRAAFAEGILLDLADPVTRGMMSVTAGRPPAVKGEVLATVDLAHRLRLHAGSRIGLSTYREPVTVVGIVRSPASLQTDAVVTGVAATYGGTAAFGQSYSPLDWLVDLPTGVSAATAPPALATHGLQWSTRAELVAAARSGHGRTDPQVVAALGATVFFGLLEVILLAGTAFAVGARRQVRDLALVRVAGGDDTDVRAVVLGQALVLGIVGTAVGLALGLGGVPVAQPFFEHRLDRAFGPYDVVAWQVVGVCAIGVFAAVAAAVVPARAAARLPIVAMLRQRFPVDTAPPRTPWWARVALVLGPVVAAGAAVGWHAARVSYAAAQVRWSRLLAAHQTPAPAGPHDTAWALLLVVGATVTLAALVRCCPELLARLGRKAGRAPLSLRLGLRDAARQRHRTAPATAAVMTVMAGAVLLAYLLSSTQVRERRQYQPSAPKGDVVVRVDGPEPRDLSAPSTTDAATARVAHLLGTTRAAVFTVLQAAAAGHTAGETGPLSVRSNCTDASLMPGGAGACMVGQVAVGDAAVVDVAAGRGVAAAAQVLEAGGAVVFRHGAAGAGVVTIDAEIPQGNQSTPRTYRLHALFVDVPAAYSGLPAAVVSAATATRFGWVGTSPTGLIQPAHTPSRATQDRIEKLLGNSGMLYVERGYEGHYGIVLLALILASGLVTAAGTSIAVALAMSEARADFATLVAVGAPPSRRRLQAMAQTAVVGVLGSTLGLGLGSLLGIGVMGGSTSYPMTVPVRWLLEIALAAPVLALLVAGLVSGGRLTLTRRPT